MMSHCFFRMSNTSLVIQRYAIKSFQTKEVVATTKFIDLHILTVAQEQNSVYET